MVKSLPKQMIMNHTTPPSAEELSSLAGDIIEGFPEDLVDILDDLDVTVEVEEFADAGLLDDLDLEDEFDLLLIYHGGDQNKETVVHKNADNENGLTLFRRPILDMWCETGEDISILLRHLIITEVAESYNFDEGDIKSMIADINHDTFEAA